MKRASARLRQRFTLASKMYGEITVHFYLCRGDSKWGQHIRCELPMTPRAALLLLLALGCVCVACRLHVSNIHTGGPGSIPVGMHYSHANVLRL